jgi:hypothetical protein
MTTLTEKSYQADLIKEEPFRQISRSLGTISSAIPAIVPRFTVLGTVTASGKYMPYDPTANTGIQVASGILLHDPNGGDANAAAADVPNCVILARGPAVVDTAFLQWGANVTTQAQKNAAYAALAAMLLVTAPPA